MVSHNQPEVEGERGMMGCQNSGISIPPSVGEGHTTGNKAWYGKHGFKLWCWRRLLRVPWTARRSNQSVLKEINPEYSLEGLMLKLKLPYYGHLMWRANSLEKTLMLGKMEGRRKRGRHRMSWLNGITDWMDMSWRNSGREWRTGKPGMLQSMESQRARHDVATEWELNNNGEHNHCNLL